jgi:hypothetical protein
MDQTGRQKLLCEGSPLHGGLCDRLHCKHTLKAYRSTSTRWQVPVYSLLPISQLPEFPDHGSVSVYMRDDADARAVLGDGNDKSA